MNNCPKCGNPLQVGVTSCPICGTAIGDQGTTVKAEGLKTQVEQPVSVQKKVVSAPSPQQPTQQPVQETISKEPAVSSNKVVGSVGVPLQNYQNKVQTASNVVPPQEQVASSTPAVEPVAPQVAPEQPTQVAMPVQAAPTPVQPVLQAASLTNPVGQVQPSVGSQKIVQASQAVPSSVQTTINTAVPSQVAISPTPGIPSSLTNPSPATLEVQNVEAPKATKKPVKKGKINKNVLLVGVIVIIMLVGIGIYMMNRKPTLKNPNIPEDDSTLAISSVVSHGFKFSLEDGWLVNEDSNNVIITNSTETVSIRLTSSLTNFSNITEEIIQKQLGRSTNFSATTISTTQISARDSYVVNTTLNESLPVQIYLVSGGNVLTLGATVIYQTEESKTKFEANVLEIIASISYSDDSIKAIGTINMYSEAFNMFNNIVTNKPIVSEETPSNNEENTENESENNVEDKQENETPENSNTLE